MQAGTNPKHTGHLGLHSPCVNDTTCQGIHILTAAYPPYGFFRHFIFAKDRSIENHKAG